MGLLELLEVGWRGASVVLGEVDGLVVVLVGVLCATSGAAVGGFGILSAASGGPFLWGGVLVDAW